MSKVIDYDAHHRSSKSKKTGHATPDAVAILHWLRQQQVITAPYYLHIHQGRAEIGWQAQAHVCLLNGEEDSDWQTALKQLADQAAAINNKAFGYIGFDAWDSQQGCAPDGSSTFPLVQFFIPQHRLCVEDALVEYQGPEPRLLDLALQAPTAPQVQLQAVNADAAYSEQQLMQAVEAAKQTLNSALSKVVLSRYLGFDYDADLLALFVAYCMRQKYADAVLMDFGTVGAAIASPELLVKVEAGKVAANPLAGTKKLGSNPAENQRLAKALLSNRKELAEHTLALVQMMQELQPHCVPGSLVVNRLLDVIQQKEVMHLSSELSGDLAEDKHCIDAMLALFPSAMVSGVPKAESIQLIRQLEQFPRGLFAGTVGWVSGRDCRFALTIRGMYKYGQRLFVQAGAGVMEESIPAQENEEIRMKMSAMLEILASNATEPVRKVG